MIQVSATLFGSLVGALIACFLTSVWASFGVWRAWKRADEYADRLRSRESDTLLILKAYDAGDPSRLNALLTDLRGRPSAPDAPMWLARRGRPPVKPGRRLHIVRDDGNAA